MYISKTYLPRRTFLRSAGVTLALPLLDAMIPALTALSNTAAAPIRRMGVFYVPNGMAMSYWVPKAVGSDYEIPRTLESLAPFRDQTVVLSGLEDKSAWPGPDEGAGSHARAAGSFLTGVHIKRTFAADMQAGISADQIAAQELGKAMWLSGLSTIARGSRKSIRSCTFLHRAHILS